MAKAPRPYGTLSSLGTMPSRKAQRPLSPKRAAAETASSQPKRKGNNLGKYLHPKGGY